MPTKKVNEQKPELKIGSTIVFTYGEDDGRGYVMNTQILGGLVKTVRMHDVVVLDHDNCLWEVDKKDIHLVQVKGRLMPY